MKTVELTPRQQELLLRGLRYVRSSAALEMRTPSADVDRDRQEKYKEIADLESLLDSNGRTAAL